MEKLELKHWCAYMPYGLKMIFEKSGNIRELTGLQTSSGMSMIFIFNELYHSQEFFNYKPILRPLSDLTKEIEHNGEKFVPIEVIGKLFVEQGEFLDGFFGWDIPTGGDDYQDYYFNIAFSNEVLHLETWCGEPNEKYSYIVETHALEYTAYNQLIKYHFDIFNLIPEGLAVDINTLK